MSFADNALKTAERILNKYGDSITIIKKTQHEYNAIIGAPSVTEENSYTKGVVEPVNQALVGSGVAEYNDITILLKAPYIDSSYDIGYQGDRYNIIAVVEKVSAQDTQIIYQVQCRK